MGGRSKSMAKQERLAVVNASVRELRPAAYNPRVMSSGELERLKRSIREWGLVEPIVVRRQDGTIIGGHQRLEAAKALGMREVPVV